MFKKRFLSVLTVLTLALGILSAGCTASKPADSGTTPAATTDSAAAAVSETTAAPEPKVDFPKKNIEFIIPNAAGGGNDTAVRALLPGLEKALGVNVLPFNEAAAKGVPAFLKVGNATPDGYKLYFNSQTSIMLQYNTAAEADPALLAPVAQVVEDAAVIFVRDDSEWKTFKDMADALNATIGTDKRFKMSSNGAGGLWHVADEVLAKALGGVKFHYIDYPESAAKMLTAVVSKEVDICVCGPAEARPFIESKQIKPLAVLSLERFPSIPDVPTCKELGYDISFPIWRGVFTTAGTDPAVLQILSDSVKAATESPEFIKFASSGMQIKYRDYKEFGDFFESQKVLYESVMPGIMAEIKQQ
jgi:tripartite-type tricarboxylate transporter receptor subunit TctC